MNYIELRREWKPQYIPYNQLLQTTEWHLKREEIISRDKRRCTTCLFGTSKKFDWDAHVVPLTEELKELKSLQGNNWGNILSSRPYYLQVHHKYYIKGSLPWEYKESVLITLCNWCHLELHKNEAIKVYNIDSTPANEYQTCSKCNGAGWFPNWAHRDNGVCYECWGERIAPRGLGVFL